MTADSRLTNHSSRPPHRDPVVEAVTILAVLLGILLATVSGSLLLGLAATALLVAGFLPMYLL